MDASFKNKISKKDSWFNQEFQDISRLISNKDYLSLYEFLRIRNFKINNSSRARDNEIKEITKKAFQLAESKKIQEAIKELCKLHGVRIPIASAILAMRYPKTFAIIDINVIEALNKMETWGKKYLTDPKIYNDYLNLLIDRSKNGKKELRILERELFIEGRRIREERS